MKLTEEGLAPLPASTVKRNVGPNPDYIKFQVRHALLPLDVSLSPRPLSFFLSSFSLVLIS
jgi:hypothetical protein